MKDQNRLSPEIDIEQELEYERSIDERGANEDEDEDEDEEEELEEEEVYRTALNALQAHQKESEMLYSAAGMFWLGMSMGWRAFRILHSRRSYLAIKVLGVTRHSLVFPR